MVAVQILRISKNEALAAAEAHLRDELKATNASPFLGQHDLPPRVANVVSGNLIDDDPIAIFETLFKIYPAVTIAYLAGLAQREAGKDGEGEFYPHLERELDHKLSQHERERLHQSFRAACTSLGLSVLQANEREAASTWFRIAEYELQAGPISALLPAVAQAAATVERDLGLPDPFDPDGTSLWQQSLVEVLEARGRKGLARVLKEDRLAWHAVAYGRLTSGIRPGTTFETRFKAAIEAARSENAGESSRLGPPVSVLFMNDEILLVPPASASGWLWQVTGSWSGEAVLRPGEELPVSDQDCVRVTAVRDPPDETVRASERPVSLWRDTDLMIFEGISGRRSSLSAAPAGLIRLLARQPFSAGAAGAATQLLCGLWSASVTIEDGERIFADLQNGRRQEIVGRLEPQLAWSSEPITLLEGKPTFGSLPLRLSLRLSREASYGWGQDLDVILRVPLGVIGRIPVVFETPTTGHVEFEDARLGDRFDRLTATLVRRGEDRPLLQAPSAWLWPGLAAAEPGYFKGSVPTNFNPGASSGAHATETGVGVTDSARRWAEIAFSRQAGRPMRFRLRRPGLLVEVEEGPDRRPLKLGSTIIDDGRPRFLRIHCDDPEAAIALSNRTIPHAFGPGGFRRVSLGGLGDDGEGDISLLPRGDASQAKLLAVVTRPCSPLQARALRAGGRPTLECQLAEEIGVFELDGTDLLTGSKICLRSNDGIATQFQNGAWRVSPDPRAVPDGAWVFTVKAVLTTAPQARPLRTTRGDQFGLVLIMQDGRPSTYGDVEHLIPAGQRCEVFSRLHELLATCWAECCWSEGFEHLSHLWSVLGGELGPAAASGNVIAQATLLQATGVAPPVNANPSWVPIRHPIELWPGLFNCPPPMVFDCLNDAEDEGARAFATLLGEPVADDDERRERHDEACRRFALRLDRAARGSMNGERLSHSAFLCAEAKREMRNSGRGACIPGAPADETESAAIVDDAPSFFSALALATRMEGLVPSAVQSWLEQLVPHQSIAHSLQQAGFMTRLGPELLAWHLSDSRRPGR